MTTFSFPSLTLVAAALLGAPGDFPGTQVGSPPTSFAVESIAVEVLGAAAPALEGVVVGDFDGDQRIDAVAHADGSGFVIWAPAAFAAVQPFGASILDLEPLPGTAKPDRIVTAGADGVHVWHYDPIGEVLASTLLTSMPAQEIAVLRWQDETAVVALSPDGRGATVLASDGAVLGTFDFQGAVARGLAGLDWDGLPGDELAVLFKQGILVWNDDGVGIASFATFGESLLFHPVQRGAVEDLAWVRRFTPSKGAAWVDVTLLRDPVCAPAIVDEPRADAVDAADLDGDGLDELVFARADSGAVVVLSGDCFATAQTFDDGGALTDHGPGRGGVSVVDFDRDGDRDVLSCGQEGALLAFRNTTQSAEAAASTPRACVHVEIDGTDCGMVRLFYEGDAPSHAQIELSVFRNCPGGALPGPHSGRALELTLQAVDALHDVTEVVFQAGHLCDATCEYYFVSRMVVGDEAGPDSVRSYKKGAYACPDQASPGAEPVPGPKVEGLNPLPRVPLGPVDGPPRGP